MTRNAEAPTYTREQRVIVKRLEAVNAKMATAKVKLAEQTAQRRQLLIDGYNAGIDTVQLGRIIGTSAETVRKNLGELGSLRQPTKKES